MKKFNYITLGDIHLGHMNNKTAYIIENLRKVLYSNTNLVNELDAIFFNGDLFERLLVTNSEDYDLIVEWFNELMAFCSGRNIKLRLLEGTPLHDSKQGKVFQTNTNKLKLDIDFKYITDIHIEHMEDFNLNILYVPDQNDKPASDRFQDIKELMKSKGLTQVDLVMMHGQFRYQLPILLDSSHNEDDFLNITKYYIHTNHIHTPSVYNRIIASGSFDRLKHGEEEDKGLIHATIVDEDNFSFNFIKNKNARIFKTIHLKEKPTTEDIENLHKELKTYPPTAFIWIKCKDDSVSLKDLKELYTFSGLKIDIVSEKESKTTDIFNIEVEYEEIHITKNNLIPLLKEEIGEEFSKEEYDIMVNEINSL